MTEKEINKILKPRKKLIALFVIYFMIGIALVIPAFYGRYEERKDPQDLSELISNGTEEEGLFVGLDIAYLPQVLAANVEKDNYLYYAIDEEGRTYIVRLSNKTFDRIKSISDEATGKLDSVYHLEGFTYDIDPQTEDLALYSSEKVFAKGELTSDNFSQYFGKVYIDENKSPKSSTVITLYKMSAMFSLLFFVFAFVFVLPAIIKAGKICKNKDLVDELTKELENLTETPYKECHVYLTQKYIIGGIQAIKYEDVIWGYVSVETKYGIKTGKNLTVYTKDKKSHTIGSVRPGSNILENILADIQKKNTAMKVGYTEENKKFFSAS